INQYTGRNALIEKYVRPAMNAVGAQTAIIDYGMGIRPFYTTHNGVSQAHVQVDVEKQIRQTESEVFCPPNPGNLQPTPATAKAYLRDIGHYRILLDQTFNRSLVRLGDPKVYHLRDLSRMFWSHDVQFLITVNLQNYSALFPNFCQGGAAYPTLGRVVDPFNNWGGVFIPLLATNNDTVNGLPPSSYTVDAHTLEWGEPHNPWFTPGALYCGPGGCIQAEVQ